MTRDNKVSLDELLDHPEKWLQVPHRLHHDILDIMYLLYGDEFKEKLKQAGCHCFECEGYRPLETVDGTAVGYVEYSGKTVLCVVKR